MCLEAMWSRCTFKQRGAVLNKINTGIEGDGELRRRERYRCISKAYDTVWQEEP